MAQHHKSAVGEIDRVPQQPEATAASGTLREVGHQACWSVSSAKAGNGVDCLRDNRKDTFWQSDGTQPHYINIQFQRKMEIAELHLHLDFKADESYTPSKVSIRAGTAIHDLREVRVVELEEPIGCIRVPLGTGTDGLPEDSLVGTAPLRAFFLQVAVLSNHQNGRDTHVRLVQVYGPRSDHMPLGALNLPCTSCTNQFAMYATVR